MLEVELQVKPVAIFLRLPETACHVEQRLGKANLDGVEGVTELLPTVEEVTSKDLGKA